jgi:uncharacterized membrane protein HdeD (DUF308 family)
MASPHRVTANIIGADAGRSADERPIAAGSWRATLSGGMFKVFLAALALSLPLLEHPPLPLWVGGLLVAGGVAELLVGWAARQRIVGKVALGSGAITAVTGLSFMAAIGMGLGQLTLLTTVWLVFRGGLSLLLAIQWRSSHAARSLLLVRGTTDLALGVALMAGLSISQIALIVFGGTPAMTNGFLLIVALSFFVAGIGLIVIATSESRWERRHAAIAFNG